MQITNRFATLLGVALCATNGIAHAAILADYRFSSNPTNSEPLVTQSTASVITRSTDVAYVSTSGNPGGMASIAVDKTDGTSETSAVAAGDYIAFTVTPNVGYALDLSDVQFDWVVQRDSAGTGDPSPLTATAFLKSSVGGFGATDPTLGTVSRGSTTFGIGVTNPWANAQIDLSSLANSSSAVTFRLYLYDNGSYANSRVRLDNLAVHGTVVPEPACGASIGIMGLLLQRRRRR
ncbi:MAG: hypothetical protein QM760_15045 [Nibricoccus sp.]